MNRVFILAICLFISIVAYLTPIQADASSDISEKLFTEKDTAKFDSLFESYKTASKFLNQYYNAEQKRTEIIFDDFFLYENLNIYLQKRLEKSKSIIYLESNELKNNLIGTLFNATYSLEDFEFRNDDSLFLKVFVDAEVQYSKKVDNYYFGNYIDFLFIDDAGTLKIADIFFYDDSVADVPNLKIDKWNSEENFLEINKIIQKIDDDINTANNIFTNIDKYLNDAKTLAELEIQKIKNEKNNAILKQNLTNITTLAASTYSFNRDAMMAYAISTASLRKHSDNKLYTDKNNTISARGSSQAPYYYDFSSFSKNYDCTNFASHVLLKGGAKMKSNGVASPNTTNGGGWYFNNTNPPGTTSRSESWTGVNQFGTFLLYNNGIGPKGVQKSNINVFLYGDIIQWKYGVGSHGYPNYGHTVIITGGYISFFPTTIFPLMTSRSANGSYQINQRFHDKLNASDVVGYRYIALTNHSY